jgi:hypothetical protein
MAKAKKVAMRRLLHWQALQREWQTRLPVLDQLSQEMRSRSISHRGFDAGVVSLAETRRSNLIVLGGANYKPHDGKRRHRGGDYCGEMENIWAARRLQCEIVGMVITCPEQIDDVSRRDFGVTVSCYYCRVEFRRELKRAKSPLKGCTRLRFNHPTDSSVPSLERTVTEFLDLFQDDPPYIPEKRGGP